MPYTIRVTGPVTDTLLGATDSTLRSFIGLELEANSWAVKKLREMNPHIPTICNTYEVAFSDALAALALANRIDAAITWDVIRPHLIYIPHTSAQIIAS